MKIQREIGCGRSLAMFCGGTFHPSQLHERTLIEKNLLAFDSSVASAWDIFGFGIDVTIDQVGALILLNMQS